MEPICAIKDIYKILYQFEKNFSEVHAITINEAMLLCCLKDNEAKSAGMICDYIGLSNSRGLSAGTSIKRISGKCFSRSPQKGKRKYNR